jgi:N-acetylmuramoyl-L-alanine amidase
MAALSIALALGSPAWAEDRACTESSFPVAIDIGHTPEAPGALSARGIPEFLFNMALGRDVVAALREAGFPAHRITAGGKGREQLTRRVAEANAKSPALLISIHHDSVQERYLEDWTFAGRSLRHSSRARGFSLFVSRANQRFSESLALARALGRGLIQAGLGFSTHHAENIPGENRQMLDRRLGVFEYRNLRVLKDVAAPAVLLEAAVIVNRDEELEAAAPARRRLVSAVIVAAVRQMCAARAGKLALH